MDVFSGEWIYRVFFLRNTLQVDLAFVHDEQFRARAPSFKLVFGKSLAPIYNQPKHVDVLAGWTWLYALHVRSSFARKKYWQTEYYLSGMRDHIFSMMCLRYNLPTSDGRGIDNLPQELKALMEPSLVRSIEPEELCRAFDRTIDVFLLEIGYADLHERLSHGLRALNGHVKGMLQ
ncbi:MAG: hypothetical protein C5B49_07930 [Bdellovibrio sp.]|nr:MAG: hypothetical protein C5B49_07930 [Bdellovibrio sp.]